MASLPRTSKISDDISNPSSSSTLSASILSPRCNTTTMGKGVCTYPPNTSAANAESSSLQSSLGVPSINLGISINQTPQEEANFPVLAIGFKNSEIHLVDVQTGLNLLPNSNNTKKILNISSNDNRSVESLRTNYNEKKDAISAMSFDSSGKYLAACCINGDVAIFKLKYHYTKLQTNQNNHQQNKESSDSVSAETVFSSFFGYTTTTNTTSSTTPSSQNDSNTATSATSETTPNKSVTNTSPPQMQRLLDTTNSPDSVRFSLATATSKPIPTCMVLDPGYARRREKSMVVGLQDGRVILTKQGFFGRLVNTVLYNTGETGGIEAVCWRGGLLAWADASGIKLFDVEQNYRLARIDRPTGARASLYPSVSGLSPYLYFEKSNSLLIVWGDCFMTMDIEPPQKETTDTGGGAGGGGSSSNTGETVKKSRKVSCSMAWELDCIACGAQTLDEDHVAILGLVPDEKKGLNNILELQILSRSMGTVTSADALLLNHPHQLESNENTNEKMARLIENASDYSLLSSFALPRMEDIVELEEEELTNLNSGSTSLEQDMEKMLNPLGNMGGLISSSSTSTKFVDSHLRWSISNVLTKPEEVSSFLPAGEAEIIPYLSKSKRMPKNKLNADLTKYSPPPIMVISSPYDTILVRTRNMDDTISHYRSKNNHHIALSLGMQHRQILRQHSLRSLIHNYLSFLLNGEDETKTHAEAVSHAARLTPMLLGGDVEMWERWLAQFAKVEGGMFVLRDYIPVRDPKLSLQTYEMALQKMLLEIESICVSPTSTSLRIHVTKRFFLNTLLAWGPAYAITERFQLLSQYVHDGSGAMKDQIAIDLFMRMQQTSKRYLKSSALMLPKEQFELWRYSMREGGASRKRGSGMMKGSSISKREGMDSLYDISSLTSSLKEKLPYFNKNVDGDPMNQDLTIILFECVAELYYISRNYQEALRLMLVVGAHFTTVASIETLEENAVNTVISPQNVELETKEKVAYNYEHVFAMLEYHNLHRYLLDESFVPKVNRTGNKDSNEILPIVALIRLVGLKLTGTFLMKYCRLPSNTVTPKDLSKDELSSSYLPITLVSNQLESHPKLLFWYLNLVFLHRPELYINFPGTSVAPTFITDLHRKHFQLFLEFAQEYEEKTPDALTNNVVDSPMMSFLKATLRHGGFRSEEIRQQLESRRRTEKLSGSNSSSLFARELAYVIEQSDTGLEEDAKTVLQLYLEGSRSIPQAVAYAERDSKHSALLWDMLVTYCLKKNSSSLEVDSSTSRNGSSFQTLLEAAAQSGADLAKLVSQIPEGMQIKGLRAMLLAAVEDYRLKLKMNEASTDIMSKDKVSLLRQMTHRSRRGLRAVAVGDKTEKQPEPTSLASSSGSTNRSRMHMRNHKMRLNAERQARLRPMKVLQIR